MDMKTNAPSFITAIYSLRPSRARLFFSTLLVLLVLRTTTANAEGRIIILGEGDAWSDIATTDHVLFVGGKHGYFDMTLADGGYEVIPGTDLLVQFDEDLADSTGNYRLVEGRARTHRNAAKLGAGGGLFNGEAEGVVLEPRDGALFSSNRDWNEISIEFWLYPVLLDEGTTIFHWRGSHTIGLDTTIKELRVSISNRALSWRMQNLFVPPDFSEYTVELSGTKVLIPRRWQHHLLRFRSDTGLIEYLVDGSPVAVTHVSKTGREATEVYGAYTGDAKDGRIVIGRGFTGFIDAIRVYEGFVVDPFLERYERRAGTAMTRVFDLDYSNSQILRIDSEYGEPADSSVLFYYRISDSLVNAINVSGDWIPFLPGRAIDGVRTGRYFQIFVEMLPNGTGQTAPTVNTISVSFEPDLPPHPPENVASRSGDGSITVLWSPSIDRDVAGYLLFYGTRSQSYFGADSSTGPSPIDVGNATNVTLEGLENGKLYYIAVVAYDASLPAHQSSFSAELSVRPSRLIGGKK